MSSCVPTVTGALNCVLLTKLFKKTGKIKFFFLSLDFL